ncbi:MAG: BrnT family toxin [Kiritimatiellae bacterium]|nr:BrnT family toxin [Kiritimatiellia bacterium]
MKFTWDETKNAMNRQKHGIDFVDVSAMFDYPMVTFLDQRKEYGEDRWIGIGWLGDILAVVVYTEPKPRMTRIISARKANRHEQSIYAEEIGN